MQYQNKTIMKKYLYYAIEENCFETEKREIKDSEIRSTIKEWLADDYCQVDAQNEAVRQIEEGLSKDGWGACTLENGQGYTIIIGVAKYGKCREIAKIIADNRKEAIAMCY